MRRHVVLLLTGLMPTTATAQAPAPSPDNLSRFDYHHVELRRQDDRWQLVANGRPLKDFGRREADARQALRLIHDLRLTQHGTIGSPQPVIEYWLADGAAPRGLVRGLRLTALDPHSTRAEQVQGQWCVRDDRQVLFQFGAHEEDAQRAAEVIRKYGFNQVGYVGQGTPSMMYFLVHHTNRDAAQGVAPSSTSTPGGDRQPLVVRPVGAAKPPVQGQLPKPAAAQPLAAALPSGRQLTAPAPATSAAAPPVDRVPFDWRTVQLKHENNDWKLVSGTWTLAHFGKSERDAKLALAVFQRYHFTEQCQVGGPKPACSYYLVNGQAPRGQHFGVSGVSFRPEALAVQERDGGYVISEGNRVLLRFDEQEQDARTTLQAIQYHKFDRWCHVGRPGQGGLTFFVRAR